MNIQFDAATHTYTLGSVRLWSVTQILDVVTPCEYYGVTDWHMRRGTVVHQCAEMIMRGIPFEHSPLVADQVAAVRAWRDMRNPDVIDTERMVGVTAPIPYAGTCDLLCKIDKRITVVDWKGSHSKRDQWQIGGYAHALQADGVPVTRGMVVDLSGKTPREFPVDIRRAVNEWRSILNVFAMRMREGLA